MKLLFIGGVADGEIREVTGRQKFVNVVIEEDENKVEQDDTFALAEDKKFDRYELNVFQARDAFGNVHTLPYYLHSELPNYKAIGRLLTYYRPEESKQIIIDEEE